MTENEAIEELQTAIELAKMCTQNFERKREIQGYEMAIKALEEVQRWHTSEINPEIKNVFANTSTQICQNCDHKDEYIVELEAEMEQYQILEKRLTEMFGDQLSLETVVDEMERVLKEPGNPHPVNAKILTYEDAKAWEEYKAIGTPEELKAAMKYVYLAKRHGTVGQVIENCVKYEEIGTPEECRAAMEKQKAKRPREYEDKYYGCPTCGNVLLQKWEKYPDKLMDKRNGLPYCLGCGQWIDWSDEE